MTAPSESVAAGRVVLPPGLRQDWPVPRFEVLGTRDGLGARLECLAVDVVTGGIDGLPQWLRERVIGGLARLGRRVDRGHSDAARDFLRTAFGELSERELDERVLEAWRHFLRVVLSSQNFARHVPIERIREHFTLDLSQEVQEIFASDKGQIVITGHMGDWEAGSAILPWIGCDPVYVVAKPPRNKPMSQQLQRAREARGVRVLPRRGAMQHASAVIEAGGTLAMLLDQRARTRPVFAPFFGRLARCDRSAGVLMKRLGAPVLLVACYRTERPLFFRAKFFDCLDPADFARQGPEEIAGRINAVFERMIREAPDQYFWLHDRYKDTPRGREGADAPASASRLSPEPPSVVE
jgi:KDO2-lipid IV(A) lauroyltransferase